MSYIPIESCIQWKIVGEEPDENGVMQVVHEFSDKNLLVNTGKSDLLAYVSQLTHSASGFIFLGVGACSVAAVVTDASISASASPGHEYIDDPTRKWARNSSGAFLSTGDITTGSYTPACYTFTKYITYKFVYGPSTATDGTASNIVGPMRTYALFNTWVLPGTVSGSSGTMLNEIVDTSSFNKNPTNQLTAYVTLWF